MAWHAYALPGLLVVASGWVLAAVIYTSNPGRLQNRLLAVTLAVEATSMGVYFSALPLLEGTPEAFALRGIEWSFQLAGGLLYLAFLGTLNSPLARPFRSPVGRGVVFGLVALLFLSWPLLAPLLLGNQWITSSAYSFRLRSDGPLSNEFAIAFAIILVYAFIVAMDAWRRSPPGTSTRAQARAYGLAFGVRDLVIAVLFIFGTKALPADVLWYIPPVAELLCFALLGYGILKTQLFDIDLKVKWTFSRGTVATAFLLVFFVVSQLIERLASERLGYISGAVAAGVMLLAINPLQKTADKLADKAMPKVNDTEAYATFRKLEVYKAAVEELAVGGVSAKERRALDALRGKLGIAASDAKAMERDIVGARGVA